MNTTLLRIAARMLREGSEYASNRVCNDYQLPATPENVELIKALIAASDYPDDEPSIYPTHTPMGYELDEGYSGPSVFIMDWQLMDYCANQLEQLADELARGKK